MNRTWLIVFGDLASFLISFTLLILLRFEGRYAYALTTHTIPFLILFLFWVLIFYVFGLYDLVTIKPTIPYLKRWILALTTSFAVGLLLFYFAPIFGISPKINLIIQVGFFGFFSFFFRRMVYALFTKAFSKPAILIGNSLYLKELENTIQTNPQLGLQIEKRLATTSELNETLTNLKNLIIILDNDTDPSGQDILNFYKKGIEIIDTAKAYEKYLLKIPVAYIDLGFIIENVDIKKNILYTSTIFLTDRILALLILILTSPFLLISAIIIYFQDKGPIFYTQNRVGLNGKVFRLYKLRSMIINGEKNGAVWANGKKDTRITPIGKIIRELHLDEIPQMINILKGDLALVGPRPERPEFVTPLESTIPHYNLRHIIRPGFTGWAQIKYRYANTAESSKEKFEYDLYYIKNRNIFLDFGIIMRTIQIIFTH